MGLRFVGNWTTTVGQGGPHGQAAAFRRIMGTHRTLVAAATSEAERGSAARRGPRLFDGHHLCFEDGHAMGISAAGDGLRLRHDVLASSARLARGRRVAEDLGSAARRTRGRRLGRSVVGGDRQLLGARHFWGEKTGPNPTDRGKNGSKRHLITDADGLPLAIEHTGANVHDSQCAIPLVDAVPNIKQPKGRRRKRRPKEVLADAAYDAEEKIREALRARKIIPTIRRRNTEHGSGLGEFRYVVEASFEWLFQWRRLRVRYEKRADIHQAFLILGCVMICWRKLEPFC